MSGRPKTTIGVRDACVSVWGCSQVGRARTHNEDSFAMDADRGLFLVADGMGGYGHGEVASRLAVESVGRWIADASSFEVCPHCRRRHSHRELLRDAVEHAHSRIGAAIERDPSLHRMGTTLTGLWLHDGIATIAHVGDSRVYRVTSGTVERLTDDHTWVREQIEAGRLSEAEARGHLMSKLLTRALGNDPLVVDVAEHPARPGDAYLLCSDGLTSMLDDAEIGACLAAESSPERRCDALARCAAERGGEDDITVVVIHVNEGGC